MEIKLKISGITPLILNRFSDAAALKASGGSRGSSAAEDRGTPLEIATSKLYLGADDKTLVVPQPNLLRCLVDGGKFHKVGRSQVTTKETSMLYACLDIEGAEIAIEYKQPWRVDTRPVVIPATKGRILAHRPKFDDWALDFVMHLDVSIMGPGLLRKIIDDAGKRIGLGDYRPARKGPFGKFHVVHWEVIEVELEEAAAA